MKTYSTRISDIQHEWHLVDATDQILGRLATKVAGLLMGKHKPLFTSNLDTGDYVIVLNASKVKVTGKKMRDKLYYRHSMYPGGLKSESLREMMQKHPDRVIEHAVKGMLPHNRLGRAMLKKLKVYANDKHPHEAQTNTIQKAKGEAS